VTEVKTRATVDFSCIDGKIEYDYSDGCNLRVAYESYLRSQLFNKIGAPDSGCPF